MTPTEFNHELERAQPGQVVTYAVGPTLKGQPVAGSALAAYFAGRVELTQKRLSPAPGSFSYLATKRSIVREPHVVLELDTLVKRLTKSEGAFGD